ncbi:uncharacterized protein PHALS_07329 [Plasmopara halstedii]|uniref:Uncharacterized protein n=1 Tax=Plasmopara halstedii TaxID=4781 RepID=A0A0N7L8D5_PLAHL|nr:uncharacterized protein PHALS_07329 [Plasmopara halstedii]CEG49571.1 hypothetical protein PHALS_07329 [Plasmopara halstedii]|eukprot:XP_024585940.1 hypothetical protein PHALS_07329 [Plasmopara halstedii]
MNSRAYTASNRSGDDCPRLLTRDLRGQGQKPRPQIQKKVWEGVTHHGKLAPGEPSFVCRCYEPQKTPRDERKCARGQRRHECLVRLRHIQEPCVHLDGRKFLRQLANISTRDQRGLPVPMRLADDT